MARADTWQVVLATARPRFLLLTPACMSLGLAAARLGERPVSADQAMLALLGGLAAHTAVNQFNEYADFRSGLDLRTVRTPFSGGSGALPAQPAMATHVLLSAMSALVLTIAIGSVFLRTAGLALLPLGLAGLALVGAYSPWITRQPLLSLLAPGLGFGPVMVVGTACALGGTPTATAWAASSVPFFLVNALLLLNQYPDVAADRSVGRRNLVMLLGHARAGLAFTALLALAYVALALAVVMAMLPVTALLGLLTLPLAAFAARRVVTAGDDAARLAPAMAANVALNLITPPLLALGLML